MSANFFFTVKHLSIIKNVMMMSVIPIQTLTAVSKLIQGTRPLGEILYQQSQRPLASMSYQQYQRPQRRPQSRPQNRPQRNPKPQRISRPQNQRIQTSYHTSTIRGTRSRASKIAGLYPASDGSTFKI
ncbi:hypothetical protein Phum_PHUM086060 [Pediculus humanus corporis]|uniref:Uncharacterized protein n=1 Tax=Pediculus humanus subsp. corporis TaxID=121224 RepID=E0VCD8_PEDHC|nr:uncharacterized protein Phum_PHUM086060 [Pediculus humanus corporis]EEB11044.1 hypothetical protein Phum_PHUM086060 [Pediculus humanus corporis]